jgi:hypothetical protein
MQSPDGANSKESPAFVGGTFSSPSSFNPSPANLGPPLGGLGPQFGGLSPPAAAIVSLQPAVELESSALSAQLELLLARSARQEAQALADREEVRLEREQSAKITLSQQPCCRNSCRPAWCLRQIRRPPSLGCRPLCCHSRKITRS